jgi:hypothetical protein
MKKQFFLTIFIFFLILLLFSFYFYLSTKQKKLEELANKSFKEFATSTQKNENPFSSSLAEGEPQVLESGPFDIAGTLIEVGGDYIIVQQTPEEENKKVIITNATEIFRLNISEAIKQNLEDAPKEKVDIQEMKIGDSVSVRCTKNSTEECLALYVETEPEE